MRAVMIKRGEIQNVSLFSSKKELEEIRDAFSQFLSGEKENIIQTKEGYDLIITKGAEDKLTLTIECKASNQEENATRIRMWVQEAP